MDIFTLFVGCTEHKAIRMGKRQRIWRAIRIAVRNFYWKYIRRVNGIVGYYDGIPIVKTDFLEGKVEDGTD